MANTLTLTSLAYDGRYMQLSCSQAIDIATNKSTISWTLSSIGGNSNNYSTGPTTVMINGVQVYYCPRVEWDTRKFPAAKGSVSGTTYVDHTTDGSKSIEVSMSTVVYGGTVRTYTETWTLDTIPRGATLLTSSNFNDTQLPTVTYSNPAGNSVESLEICIADDKAWVGYVPYRSVNKTGDLSYTFTADDVTALKNITKNFLVLTFVLRTKIGGEYLYDSIPNTFTVTENDDTKPVVRLSVSRNNSSLPSAFADMYIQGKSRVDVSISADGRYGAEISSYLTNVDGKGYSQQQFTSDVIQSAGSVSISCSVKDFRGFTGTAAQRIDVVEYSKPSVTVTAYRCNSSGEEDPEGAFMRVGFTATITSLDGKNSASYTINYGGAPITGSGTSYISEPIACDVSKVWSVEVKVDDALDSTTKAAVVPVAFTLMDFYYTGKGVALGKVATREGFDCAMPAYFTGGVYVGEKTLADYITEVVNG